MRTSNNVINCFKLFKLKFTFLTWYCINIDFWNNYNLSKNKLHVLLHQTRRKYMCYDRKIFLNLNSNIHINRITLQIFHLIIILILTASLLLSYYRCWTKIVIYVKILNIMNNGNLYYNKHIIILLCIHGKRSFRSCIWYETVLI